MSKKITKWLSFKQWLGDDDDLEYSIWEAIQSRYWIIIPYEWRPHELWYKTKCFCWKRYSTIRARSLPHTWMDRDTILAHTMFEILSQFVEQECGPNGNVDWYPEEAGHKIVVGKQWNKDTDDDPNAIWVRDEIQNLYDWWNKTYLPYWHKDGSTAEWEAVFKFNEDHQPDILKPKEDGKIYNVFEFEKVEDLKESRRLTKIAQDADENIANQLDERLHRILNLRHYMWT